MKKYIALTLVMAFLSINAFAYDPKAKQIKTDTTNFDSHLDSGDTTVQIALDSLDDIGSVASGTAGYVAYYPSSGTSISGQTTLYINNDSGYVGVGTASPQYALDVNGAIRTSGTAGITMNNGGAVRTTTTSGQTYTLQAYDTDGVAYTTFGTLTAGTTPTFDLSSSVTLNGVPLVGTTTTQTLTNKTLTTPVITSISNSGTVTVPSGTDTLANLAGTQTFTNKTLTSPKVGTALLDTNGANLFTYSPATTAVNYLNYANGATGTNPTYTVVGDANRGVTVSMAGTGGLTIVSTNTGASTIKRGLTVNNDSNSGSGDDLVAKTALNANAFQVDASAEKVNIGVVLNLAPAASPPGSPVSGDVYVDSTPSPDELCFYDGAAWQGLSSGTDGNCA